MSLYSEFLDTANVLTSPNELTKEIFSSLIFYSFSKIPSLAVQLRHETKCSFVIGLQEGNLERQVFTSYSLWFIHINHLISSSANSNQGLSFTSLASEINRLLARGSSRFSRLER